MSQDIDLYTRDYRGLLSASVVGLIFAFGCAIVAALGGPSAFRLWAVTSILGIVSIVFLVIGLRLRASAAETRRLLMSGIAAQAAITRVTWTVLGIPGDRTSRRVVMDLLVQVPGRPPYEARHAEFMQLILRSRLTSGAPLALRVDPADPKHLAIDWQASSLGAVPTTAPVAAAAVAGPGSAMDESLSQVQAALSASGAAGVPAAYASPEEANLTVEQLRAWLRANGLPAQARVDVLADTGKIIGDERLYTMEMTLFVPGIAPEKLERSAAMVPLSAMPRIQQGMILPVRVASQNHHLLTVEWDKV